MSICTGFTGFLIAAEKNVQPIQNLFTGRYTYTADDRFKAVYHEDSSEWLLRISNTQMRDEGIYECQVSTQPVRSLFVQLRVVGKCKHFVGVFKEAIHRWRHTNLTPLKSVPRAGVINDHNIVVITP